MSNENSLLKYESGVTPTAMSALTDSGDRTCFTSDASLFSESSGNAPDIRPDGLLTGGAVIPGVSASDDVVDVASLTCYLAGVNTSVTASADESITRPASAVAKTLSIQITSAGAISIVAGTDAADTTFLETRGTDPGEIPYILVGSIEIAQVRLLSDTSAPITSAEIFQTIGTHLEKSDFPVYTADNALAQVDFDVALPASHTGDLAKGVFASYADPIFTEQPFANDFVPSETSFSVSSEQVYGAVVGSSSSSLGQGAFTAILTNGITDNIISRKGENLWFQYFQDKNKLPHIFTQGKLGVTRSFGASDNPKVACTISSAVESVERAA